MAALPQGMAEGGHRVKVTAGGGAEQAVVGQEGEVVVGLDLQLAIRTPIITRPKQIMPKEVPWSGSGK
jgi:hypothetical protein